MNADHIVIRRTEAGSGFYTVEAEGKISTYLCWGEMLEQVISLTHPDIKRHRYHARTVEEEEAEELRRRKQFAKPLTAPGSPADQDFAEVEPAPPAQEAAPEPAPPRSQCARDPECVLPNGHVGNCDTIPF